MARQFLYDSVDQLRLANLRHSAYRPLAQDVVKIQQEESYHQMHTVAWMERLAHGTSEARHYLEQALESLWPDVPGLFEAFRMKNCLSHPASCPLLTPTYSRNGVQPLNPFWSAGISPFSAQEDNLPYQRHARSSNVCARLGGRHGHHTQDFHLLWEHMTKVYRLDPLANW